MDWQRIKDANRDAGGPSISQRQIDYFGLRAPIRLLTLVQQGRDAFEQGKAEDILAAGGGAFFVQRLVRRLSGVLHAVVERDHEQERCSVTMNKRGVACK
jgi:hypothetical protein